MSKSSTVRYCTNASPGASVTHVPELVPGGMAQDTRPSSASASTNNATRIFGGVRRTEHQQIVFNARAPPIDRSPSQK